MLCCTRRMGGPTLYEQMGMATKAERFSGGLENLGPGPDSASQATKEFDRLEQYAKLHGASAGEVQGSGRSGQPQDQRQPDAVRRAG